MSQPSQQVCVKLTGVSALMHFLVDGLCICCLHLTTTGTTNIVMTYVTYNVLAFLTQPLTGWWADRMKQRHWLLIGSVVVLTFAVLTASAMTDSGWQTMGYGVPITSVLLGMGNSLFHVWGGKQVAVHTGNDIRSLGVFVSTGAFGLAVGAVFASWLLLYVFLLAMGVLAMKALPIPSLEGEGGISTHEDTNKQGNDSFISGKVTGVFLLLLIMLMVAGRSFAGEAFTTGVTKGAMLILVLGGVSMLGKMAGGWIAQSMGIWKALLFLVAGTVLCFFGKDLHIAVMLTGLFLINCTMPITLYWANVLLKGYEGLAFGLLAAALIPGYLLATF